MQSRQRFETGEFIRLFHGARVFKSDFCTSVVRWEDSSLGQRSRNL